MRTRIDILKEIMEIEKQYALEEIDSEIFDNRMQILEKQLFAVSAPTDDELREAINAREIPLSANSLVGKISIEDLLPTFNVPRTFFRHLKIRREIQELARNIRNLNHNMQKLNILIAEKKVNPDTANIKIETLEFDLRLAQNRFGAREKYLKRNPSKGELVKFTLKNYLKFSYGHGVETESELKQLSSELTHEIEIRKEYRKAIAELLATVKTTQLEISTSTSRNGLPDFKSLLDFQQSVNELKDYIKILSEDIKDYSNCLTLLEKDILVIDDSHDLYVPEKFGLEIAPEETKELIEMKKSIDPLIETLEFERQIDDPISYFLIDTTDSPIIEEIKLADEEIIQPSDSLIIPETPQPVYEPVVELEIIGMEDFTLPFEINGSKSRITDLTEQIIFQSFEGLLSKLIGEDEVETSTVKPIEVEIETPKAIAQFSSLSSDLKKTVDTSRDSGENLTSDSDSLSELTEDLTIVSEIEPMAPEELIKIDTDNLEIISEAEETQTIEVPTIPTEHETLPPPPPQQTLPIPPPPPPKPSVTKEIISETEPVPEIVQQEVEEVKLPERKEEPIVKPTKETMISPKLLEAASEAWKLTGKALFNLLEDTKREFLGYLQEVIVYGNNRLGFILVTETEANQSIIDKIFDQIKPLWITEDLTESVEKRKNYVIREVMESLQVQKDVALHVTRLQEFANFRNVNYPKGEVRPVPEIIGIVPVDKIRIKRGSIISSQDSVLASQPYRTAPWDGKIGTAEKSPVGKYCYLSHGVKIGKVIATVKHPLMGKLLLLDKEEPDNTLIDYLVDRLNITEEKSKEKMWLVKYLIAKQLRIPEGEALKPKTLINYSLNRGFPILPNEILNSFRLFVSGGSIDKVTKSKVILRNSSRTFRPSEIFPLECLRVRTTSGRHMGTCLGLSLSDHPVILVSEKLSREIVVLFSNATVEKEIMSDISHSVMGTIGVDLKDSLCSHNILKTLIVGRKVQSLADYGKLLSRMNVTGYDLSTIQVVEKGTIFTKTHEAPAQNMFPD
ncbi:MAG: hypothetical protein GPJ52_03005 [Candidatus Heimdallarchaeota archaeon]|nr:hypothetical protein [Candidatus Heimdallarchaeota archaeon]